jgi:hypothetical protein
MMVHELREPVSAGKNEAVHRIIVGIPMQLNRIGGALAVIAVVCVLSIFFFPAMRGPYSVVHGPVTALLAARAAVGLRMAIAGVRVVRDRMGCVRMPLARSVWTSLPFTEFRVSSLSTTSSAVLRC